MGWLKLVRRCVGYRIPSIDQVCPCAHCADTSPGWVKSSILYDLDNSQCKAQSSHSSESLP